MIYRVHRKETWPNTGNIRFQGVRYHVYIGSKPNRKYIGSFKTRKEAQSAEATAIQINQPGVPVLSDGVNDLLRSAWR